MQAFYHWDKQLIVLPAFVLAINSACYSMIPDTTIIQPSGALKIYPRQSVSEPQRKSSTQSKTIRKSSSPLSKDDDPPFNL